MVSRQWQRSNQRNDQFFRRSWPLFLRDTARAPFGSHLACHPSPPQAGEGTDPPATFTAAPTGDVCSTAARRSDVIPGRPSAAAVQLSTLRVKTKREQDEILADG
ncbi:unnamed protein product [Boreogadus saida]